MKLICVSDSRTPMMKFHEIFGNLNHRYSFGECFDIWTEEVPPAPKVNGAKLVLTVHDLRHTIRI
ncbi:MAG: hypothetical protein KAR44_02435 [Candidatus Aegiribacteria sp.]|nr:hypothetical protein [Candidatus Aegiribacteria sp.]